VGFLACCFFFVVVQLTTRLIIIASQLLPPLGVSLVFLRLSSSWLLLLHKYGGPFFFSAISDPCFSFVFFLFLLDGNLEERKDYCL
jgi:hypothetical protein